MAEPPLKDQVCDTCGEPLEAHEIYGQEEPLTPDEVSLRTVAQFGKHRWPGVYCPST